MLASLVAQTVKASAYNAGDPGPIPGLGRSLEKEMATHSSIPAWKIPETEEPDRLTVHGATKSQTRLSNFTSLLHLSASSVVKVFFSNFNLFNSHNNTMKQGLLLCNLFQVNIS